MVGIPLFLLSNQQIPHDHHHFTVEYSEVKVTTNIYINSFPEHVSSNENAAWAWRRNVYFQLAEKWARVQTAPVTQSDIETHQSSNEPLQDGV